MEGDEMLSPNQIKLETGGEDDRQYRLVDGRLVPMESNIMEQFSAEADLCLSNQTDGLHSVYSEVADVPTDDLDEDTISSLDSNDVLVQLMDIRTSLLRLRSMLEQRIGTDLSDYDFWLQDSKRLDIHKTLVDQCINRAGLVQVNIQIRPAQRRINIVDVLKPDEDFLHMAKEDRLALFDPAPIEGEVQELPVEQDEQLSLEPQEEVQEGGVVTQGDTTTPSSMAKWMVDAQFKSDQKRLNIPEDPKYWTIPQVRHWIQWAVRQFNLTGIKLSEWSITGKELCDMSLPTFKEKCPSDPGDLFWTHLELLRKCKFIAVVQNEDPSEIPEILNTSTSPSAIRKKPKPPMLDNKTSGSQSISLMSAAVNRSGNNGQIQLWQFLLELLTSTQHTSVIQWIGTNGEFKLQEPEVVAKLWGLRKHKPTMNYEKLSRALRYYYDGDMISKVHGKRFVYRFVCDLKQLIGYDAGDLARLVNSGANPSTKVSKEDANSFELYC